MFPDDTLKQRIQDGQMYSSLQVDVNLDSDQLKVKRSATATTI